MAAMNITLVYRGSLPASQGDDKKSADKQRIRLEFSDQLRNLWAADPYFIKVVGGQEFAEATLESRRLKPTKLHGSYAFARVPVCGFRTLAIANTFNGLICHLNVTFLRREDPGAVVHGGDIDNRLKTLLDALRMPLHQNEVPAPQWGHDEAMLYCLLEDDSLISRLSVDTRRLWTSLPGTESLDYAELIIEASIVALRSHAATRVGF